MIDKKSYAYFTAFFAVVLLGLAARYVYPLLDVYLTPASGSAEKGKAYYSQGVSAATVAGQSAAFNAALDEFLGLEAAGNPVFGSGKLYYNIGNTYFQLEEYPRAILYYARAERLMLIELLRKVSGK